MFSTEFEFTLPRGYADGEGNLHRQGTMRLAKAMDEIVPLRDPRVKANPAYATVLILARVVTQLGAVESVTPRVIENLYAIDLNYLYDLYREVNELAPLPAAGSEVAESAASQESPVLPSSVAVGGEQ